MFILHRHAVFLLLTTLASAMETTTATSSINLTSLLSSLQSAVTSSATVKASSEPASISSTSSLTRTMTSSLSTSTETSLLASASSSFTSITSVAGLTSTSTSFPTMSPGTSDQSSATKHKTLVIVLAVVFSLLGIILICIGFVLIRRYRRRMAPFSRFPTRGVTPIDDDEIATWRGNIQSMAQTTPVHHHRHTSSANMFVAHPEPVWSPGSSPKSFQYGVEQIMSPPIIAQAPNARSGLTDETKPGEAAFIPPVKRQSSRLSKHPHHGRSKSRRSSISVSIKDRPTTAGTYYGVDDDGSPKHHRGDSRASRSGSIAKTSMDRMRGSYMYNASRSPPQDVFDPSEMQWIPAHPELPIHPADIGRALV